MPVSRFYSLERSLQSLKHVEISYSYEYVFYLDTDDPRCLETLERFTQQMSKVPTTIYISGNKAPTDVNMKVRRNRIIDMKERSKALIRGDYVFGVEDDTIIPKDAFKILMAHFIDEQVGFVEGVQLGRHDIQMVGAWLCDDLDNPTKQMTVLPNGEDLEQITGGGFYCYITPTSLYIEADYRWHDECFGPDVCYVMDLCRKGYDCYIDWRVGCDHITEQGVIEPDISKAVSIEYNKIQDEKKGDFWKLQPYRRA